MSDTPAGWYPDPTPATAVPTLRYWDGQTWTEHVRPPAVRFPRPTGPATEDGVALASWGQRFLAYAIDFLPIIVISAVVLMPATATSAAEMERLSGEYAETGDFGAYWVATTSAASEPWTLWLQVPIDLAVIAYLVAMLRWKGATLGKLAVGIRVRLWAREGRLPWSSILLRVTVFYGLFLSLTYLNYSERTVWLGAALFLPLVVFSIVDALWPLWDSRRQALHDKPARTCVVKTR